jgi:hypothetical protein
MGRVLLDQGQPEAALDAMRQATSLTPGSVARLVKHGLLAFYYGEPKEAADVLGKAARLGLNSRVFDLQGLVLLAAVQFDIADRRALNQSLHAIEAARASLQGSARLRRFSSVIRVLNLLLERKVADAVVIARELIAEIPAPNFEFEAACNLLAMLSRLSQNELQLDGVLDDVGQLARRFAVSHTTTELLVRASNGHAGYEAIIREAYSQIAARAEEAVSRILAGQPTEAVQMLLQSAETTRNAKLIDLAMHTIERHRDRIVQVETLQSQVASLHSRYRGYGTQVHLSRGGDPRMLTGVGAPEKDGKP